MIYVWIWSKQIAKTFNPAAMNFDSLVMSFALSFSFISFCICVTTTGDIMRDQRWHGGVRLPIDTKKT